MSYLEVTDLRVEFGGGQKPALRGISFSVDERERLGIIGQSGSGKSVTALAIMGLLPAHAQVTGSIRLGGRELVGLPERELQRLRGDEILLDARIVAVADVFDAMTSERPYREAGSIDAAVEVLSAGAGTHFDSAVVHAMLEIIADSAG